MATKKQSVVIDTSDAAWKKTEAKFNKMSKAAAAHLNDFEAGVSRDAKKKAAKKTTTRKKK
jgi:hypothetical protein